ncbi:MAG: phospho-N-acetylmuramoyl-pentapeptide-transferase [Dermatophilaceae bacterium]
MKSVVAASAIALVVALLCTPLYVRFLVKRRYGQFIRDDGPDSHKTKRGTPTMGGAVMIFATILGYLGAHLATLTAVTASGLLVLGLMTGLGFVGWLDDYIKIRKQRSLGLRSAQKLGGQLLVGSVFAVAAVTMKDHYGVRLASTAISFVRDISWLDFFALGPVVGLVLVVVWVNLIVAGASNGVNLTDGLDGLATGACTMVFGGYVLIGIWQSNQNCHTVVSTFDAAAKCYDTPNPYDLAICAAALAGATFGFLWWNASPAKIFMGDTGSLALGGALAGLAVLTRTELLMVPMGGLFVIITLSVIIQVGYFKLSGGKRVFRMAPLQHHFELKGWNEVTIVIRFWIIAGVCAALALGMFYAEWIVGGAL